MKDRFPGKILKWCEEHQEPVWWYDDESWRCWWQTTVETRDETQCVIVDTIPEDVFFKAAQSANEPCEEVTYDAHDDRDD